MGRVIVILAALLAGTASGAEERFVPLEKDGIHDPTTPGFELLQQPAESLKGLPKDAEGNPDWMQALIQGYIEPRTGVTGKEKMRSVNLDIVMQNTGSMPFVRFRHITHTQWLTCSDCHTGIFLPQKGGNFITMSAILEGQYCGVCHGKVAFQPLACARCHNVPSTKRGLR